jgi:2-amino-4-hydroxy-6-hydroxymethyldihydropteridine diphosphokinase
MGDEEAHRVYLGLGCNLGDRRGNLLAALRLLDGMEDISVLEVSSVYETRPWGVLDQPDFLNLVTLVSTSREPHAMLAACGEVETELGRVRAEMWGPRVIDVDILLYDDLSVEEEELIIPHPHMLERDFVMVPLMELQPEVPLPGMDRAPARAGGEGEDEIRPAFRYDKEEWHG